jgi:hypothetical protein
MVDRQRISTGKMADLNDAELLGFEWLERDAATEQAVGIAFNKRGLSGEGPTKSQEGEGPAFRAEEGVPG